MQHSKAQLRSHTANTELQQIVFDICVPVTTVCIPDYCSVDVSVCKFDCQAPGILLSNSSSPLLRWSMVLRWRSREWRTTCTHNNAATSAQSVSLSSRQRSYSYAVAEANVQMLCCFLRMSSTPPPAWLRKIRTSRQARILLFNSRAVTLSRTQIKNAERPAAHQASALNLHRAGPGHQPAAAA